MIDMIVLWVVGTIKDAVLAFGLFGSFNIFQPGGMQGANIMLFYTLSILSGMLIGVGYYWFFLNRLFR